MRNNSEHCETECTGVLKTSLDKFASFVISDISPLSTPVLKTSSIIIMLLIPFCSILTEYGFITLLHKLIILSKKTDLYIIIKLQLRGSCNYSTSAKFSVYSNPPLP